MIDMEGCLNIMADNVMDRRCNLIANDWSVLTHLCRLADRTKYDFKTCFFLRQKNLFRVEMKARLKLLAH